MGIDGKPQDGGHGSGGNLVVLVFSGLMLLGLVGTAVVANDVRKRLTAPKEEEIVFEPEIVSMDGGSVKLNASYSTDDTGFLHADGEDEIPLSIVKKEGTEGIYNVSGTLKSVQKVGVDGMDKGQICTVHITHDVTYVVNGTFSSASCTLELSVRLALADSQLLGTGCSVDINLDPSGFHVEPVPGKLVFTKALASQSSGAFSFYLFDVSLPSGVTCPALSKP